MYETFKTSYFQVPVEYRSKPGENEGKRFRLLLSFFFFKKKLWDPLFATMKKGPTHPKKNGFWGTQGRKKPIKLRQSITSGRGRSAIEGSVCSGHGVCLDGAVQNGACRCVVGYGGASCGPQCPGASSPSLTTLYIVWKFTLPRIFLFRLKKAYSEIDIGCLWYPWALGPCC